MTLHTGFTFIVIRPDRNPAHVDYLRTEEEAQRQAEFYARNGYEALVCRITKRVHPAARVENV